MPLVATDISFSYGSRFALVHGSLAAAAGEFVGVIGANGSGKTTMLKLVSGLLPRRSGTILLDGTPLESFTANRRARHLAFVPQMQTPVFEFTVEQTVL